MQGRCRALVALLLALCGGTAQAGNPCILASGGIGGTGAPAALASDDGTDSGIGGTGNVPGDGIGGTGATARSDSGGMGGTGAVADEGGIGGTGIVGVITGFGSICVGGIEIHYGAATPISSDGRPLSATQLKIGHVVQVQARGVGDSVRAKSIELVHVVSGPVGTIDVRTGRLEVLGQPVRASSALVEQARAAAKAGHPVEVSGLRDRSGEIVATRVDAAPGLREFGVIGPVQSVAGGGARIGNLPIRLDAKQAREVRAGQSVEVCGPLVNGALRARTVESKGVEALREKGVRRVIVEGFVGQRDRDRLKVGDVTVGIDQATRLTGGGEIKLDQRVVVAARVVEGALVAERVERVRERDHGHRGASGGDKSADDGSDGSKDADEGKSGSGHGGGEEGKSGSGHGNGDEGNSGSGHGSGDSSESGHGGGSEGGRDADSHGGGDTRDSDSRSASDARKEADKALERAQRDAQRARRDSAKEVRDASRSPKEPRPERPSGSSSHGAKPDRVRDK